jgi:hypothetical protein
MVYRTINMCEFYDATNEQIYTTMRAEFNIIGNRVRAIDEDVEMFLDYIMSINDSPVRPGGRVGIVINLTRYFWEKYGLGVPDDIQNITNVIKDRVLLSRP